MITRVEGATDLADFIRPEDRIIEVAARDAAVADDLARHGRCRYLALVNDDALDVVRRDAVDLADRACPLSEVSDLREVGADVLILHGRAVRLLWVPRELREVRIVVAPVGSWEARLAGGFQRRAGNLRPLGTAVIGGRRHRIFKVSGHRVVVEPRVYLSPVIGHSGLLSRLEEAGARGVVLRWFEDLPYVEPGEDLDLLVADEDVDKVRALITEEPGTLPIDLYSVTGLPGSDREGVACYPPPLAQRIVTRAVRHRSGAWVPAPDDYLHALAHHAVYHKGEASGLPSTLINSANGVEAEHEYGVMLAGIAGKLGVKIPDHIEELDEYLEYVGWRPPMDTLRRLSTTNRWVKERFFLESRAAGDEPEAAVFILRQRALDVVDMQEVRRLLDHLGFEVLEHRQLDPTAAERCQAQLRGGNWGPGPYPTSGGAPASVLVALHYGPRPVDPDSRARYPHLTNRDVLAAKEMLRDLVNGRVAPEQHCNPIHSSDNEEEAWEYVMVAMPDELPRLHAMVEERRANYCSPLPVVKVLNRGRRAKVELVQIDGKLAVRKTFGHGFLRHLEREKQVSHALAGHPGIPPLLTSGSTWIIRPYFRDQLQYEEGSPTLVPLRILREMVQILRVLHEAGFALIDAKPDNFLMDEDGVKLVDLEFMYEYPEELPPFHHSYSWHGPPPDTATDLPVGPLSYEHTWARWTGMSVEALCYATPRQQWFLRVRYRTRWTARRIARLILRGPGRLLSRIRNIAHGVRARGRVKYRSWARARAADLTRHH